MRSVSYGHQRCGPVTPHMDNLNDRSQMPYKAELFKIYLIYLSRGPARPGEGLSRALTEHSPTGPGSWAGVIRVMLMVSHKAAVGVIVNPKSENLHRSCIRELEKSLCDTSAHTFACRIEYSNA